MFKYIFKIFVIVRRIIIRMWYLMDIELVDGISQQNENIHPDYGLVGVYDI